MTIIMILSDVVMIDGVGFFECLPISLFWQILVELRCKSIKVAKYSYTIDSSGSKRVKA